MGIDTGNGGFDVDGKSYTYDTVLSGEDGAEPVNSTKGDIDVDDSVRDIGEKVKITIGQYLGELAKSNKNDFSVDSKSKNAKITDEKGYPVKPSSTDNAESFSDFNSIDGTTNDSEDLRQSTTKVPNDPRLEIEFKKGKNSAQIENGHDVLKSVEKNKLPDTIKPYISSVFSNNRFSNASTAFQTVDVKSPEPKYNAIFHHPEFGEITSGRLAQLGAALSIRSSAELGSNTAGNNPASFGSEAQSLLPSFNQLGLARVNTVELEALQALKDLTTNEIPESALSSISPGGSWGNLNNVHEHFSDLSSLGMITLSVGLTATVLALYESLGFLISLINSPPSSPSVAPSGAKTLGYSNSKPTLNTNSFPPTLPPDIAALIGIRPTVHEFGAALTAGTQAFFGVSNDASFVDKVSETISSAIDSPGFNIVVARTIIRAGSTIIDSFKAVNGNPISVAKGILNIIDVIRSSKIIGAMNVFAQIGDILLVDENSDDLVSESGEPTKKSKIDKLANNVPAAAVRKNRLNQHSANSPGSLKLAWASNTAPASYLLPDSTSVLSLLLDGLGGPKNILGVYEDKARIFYKRLDNDEIKSRGARIPYDGPGQVTVKKIEEMLEGEYVPFYFHDLRTNEIISFHAFLTSLSDNYTPNWESTEAFGRVDPIHVYRSTTRRISLSWHVVATSEEDFNDMWFKINKLVTMVYPQYTRGRLAATQNSKITQPFSQMQGASPLIRMRLGDLIKSNYSRFALARLFGADSGEMKINDELINFKNSEVVITNIKQRLDDEKKHVADSSYTWTSVSNNLPVSADGNLSPSLPALPGAPISATNNSNSARISPVFNVLQSHLKFFEFKIKGTNSKSQIKIEPFILRPQQLTSQFGMSSNVAQETFADVTSLYNSDNNASEKVIGGTYLINAANLLPSFAMINKIKNEVAVEAGVNEDAMVQLNDFMNPEKNALVRAFQSTRGKGLAGKIDSIDFDFYDNVTWDTSPGQKAPQMLKVNISFSPIHDISPGLDHSGFNRAPVYPVGHLSPNDDNVTEGNK